MRYRPFDESGGAISNLTLSLGRDAIQQGPQAVHALVYAALEAGINSYHLQSPDPVLAETVGQALSSVERSLVYVTLLIDGKAPGASAERDFSAEAIQAGVDGVLNISGLGWLDVVLLDEPGEMELSQRALAQLKTLRSSSRVRRIGISGGGDVMDAYVSTGAFDVLVSPYNVNSEWKVRSRLRHAIEKDMMAMSYDYYPQALHPKAKGLAAVVKKGLFGLGKPKAAAAVETASAFDFLHHTTNWSAEEICLGYALTEPAVASILISAADVEALNQLAQVPERDLPPGLAAQIEMARVDTPRA